MNDRVSVVMAARGRPMNTRRALKSYTKISYPNWEMIFTVVTADDDLRDIYDEFKSQLPIQYVPFPIDGKIRTPARTWNYGFKHSEGRYVIFTGADILISGPDMIERFLAQEDENSRINVLTYHLNRDITANLDRIDWFRDPMEIHRQPGFWDSMASGGTNLDRKLAGLTTYITGQARDRWEWFGLFREEDSHVTSDQDVLMRDYALIAAGIPRKSETLKDYVAYHQWHPDTHIDTNIGGWVYENERQARLLEPAKIKSN